MCVDDDGICHVNGCQATPDPDCELPENSSSNESSSSANEPSIGGSTVNGTNGVYNYSDTDLIKLTDNQVDFGDNIYIAGVPLGFGSVQWSLDDGFYTPRLVGTLHINNASGKFVRMHMGYYDSAGGHLYTDHSVKLHASDNKHDSMPVILSPSTPMQIFEVRVCTEISDDGDNFSQVDCKTVDFD